MLGTEPKRGEEDDDDDNDYDASNNDSNAENGEQPVFLMRDEGLAQINSQQRPGIS